MRSLILIIFMVYGCMSFGQKDSTNSLSLITSPGSYEDGFNFGLQFEYQNDSFYVGPEIFVFPNLHDKTYTHGIVRIGLNTHLDVFKQWRIFGGARLGPIFRDNNFYALIGGEGGIVYTFQRSNLFLGLSAAYDAKTDSKLWSNDDYHYVASGWIRIGYRIF